MNESKTICTEVEGLLPLYVGADPEKDQLGLVAEHLKKCTSCTLAFSRTREARGLLRAELIDLVDGREPQLWPALREQLQAEGLFQQAAEGVPVGGVLVASKGKTSSTFHGQLHVAPIIPGLFGRRRFQRAASLAAGITAVFFLGKMLYPQTVTENADPSMGDGLVSVPENLKGTGFRLDNTSEDLLVQAGTAAEVESDQPQESGAVGLTPSLGGLRPMPFGEQSLADVARQSVLDQAAAYPGGILLVAPQGFQARNGVTPPSPNGLASDFSLQ